MAFGFPARYTQKRKYPLPPHDLSEVAKTALQRLGWAYTLQEWGTEYHARTPVGNWTWGEVIRIKLLADGVIEARSTCFYGGQWFDFGTNKRNVLAFFAQVEQMAGPQPPAA